MAPYGSKQCSDSEGKISKSELSAVALSAQFEAVQCLRRNDRLGRTVFSSPQTLQKASSSSDFERPVATEHA